MACQRCRLCRLGLDNAFGAFQLGDMHVAATASAGRGNLPDDGHDSETLLKHADVAMYRSKEVGATRSSF